METSAHKHTIRGFPGVHVQRNDDASVATLERGGGGNGFHTVPARSAALVALAEKLPAAVLAQLLEISIDTAHKWSAYTQHNWSAYLAVRDRDLTRSTRE